MVLTGDEFTNFYTELHQIICRKFAVYFPEIFIP